MKNSPDKISLDMLKAHQAYISDSQNSIQEMKKNFPNVNNDLDYSVKSLKVVDEIAKKHIVKNEDTSWPPKPSLTTDDERTLIVQIAYYVAEVFIQNLNASWAIDDEEKSPTYGESILIIPNKKNSFNPLRVVLASTKNYKSLYENFIFWEQSN